MQKNIVVKKKKQEEKLLVSVLCNKNTSVAVDDEKSVTSYVENNNSQGSGLNSMKFQLRILFDIIDLKRNRKWFRRDSTMIQE